MLLFFHEQPATVSLKRIVLARSLTKEKQHDADTICAVIRTTLHFKSMVKYIYRKKDTGLQGIGKCLSLG